MPVKADRIGSGKANQILTVRFHGMAGREAVGRDENGLAVFAPFAAPGDLARVVITKQTRAFARGEVVELLEAGPQRAAPGCPYFGPQSQVLPCGGCQWQHVTLEAQLEAKRLMVRDALQRIGGLHHVEVEPCLPSPPWNYRNKADFEIRSKGAGIGIGFNAFASRDLVNIESCPIQSEANNAVLAAVRQLLLSRPEWVEAARTTLPGLVVRSNSSGEALALLEGRLPHAEVFAAALMGAVPGVQGLLVRGPGDAAETFGQDWLLEQVDGLELRVTGSGFFQVNQFLTATLLCTVLEMLQPQPGERALDLFCGVGLFALGMARAGAKVTGVEAYAPAIEDARWNAKRNSLKARFEVGLAARYLQRSQPGAWDAVVLDPPRSGAADLMPLLAAAAPPRAVYVSCDPATLARDLKVLCARL